MVGPIGRVVRLVSGGIGLAIEGVEAHKQKKAQEKARAGTGSNAAESSASGSARNAPPMEPIDDLPPEYVQVSDEHADELIKAGKAVPVEEDELEKRDIKKHHDEDDDSDESRSDVDDEAEWALDEAQERAMGPPPAYDEVERQESGNKQERLAEGVLKLAAPASASTKRIPYPVILPQRRPRDKGRGFVRAYAPVLENCGIPQNAFMTFLKNWEEASKVSTTAYFNWIETDRLSGRCIPQCHYVGSLCRGLRP